MCTLVVAWQVFTAYPVCVATNRDEAVDRPSVPPKRHETSPRIIAPQDNRAGGTWLGYNEHGLFVAVTNRWVAGEGDRSRGLLVMDALSQRTAEQAIETVQDELAVRDYAPFNILAADSSYGNNSGSCYLFEHEPTDQLTEFDPGVHIVVNVGADGNWFVPTERPMAGRDQAANAETVRTALEPRPDESAKAWTTRAGEILGDHDYGVCLHRNGFGTRSSSLLRLGRTREFEFADGPPCQTPFEPVSESILL